MASQDSYWYPEFGHKIPNKFHELTIETHQLDVEFTWSKHNVHILFLTDNFPPEGNAPARTFEHAREWVIQGHNVTVITCAYFFRRKSI